MSYLNEAFKRLAALDEDAFDITTEDGVENLDDFIDKDSFIDKIEIIDPDAQDEDEIKDSYVGKVILDCCVCHSKIYKDKEDVHIDEEVELANVDEECPFCFTTGDGFKVVGEIAPFGGEDHEEEIKDKEEVEVEEKLEESDKPAALSIEDAQKWVDYDMKRYHKISDRTNRLVKKAGFQIIKDDHGDYEVAAGKYESKNESLSKKKLTESNAFDVFSDLSARARSYMDEGRDIDDAVELAIGDGFIYNEDILSVADEFGWIDYSDLANKVYDDLFDKVRSEVEDYMPMEESKKLTEEPVYGLNPEFDSRKSFYNKARVDVKDDKNQKLYSYDTLVAEIVDGKPKVYNLQSQTTLRHVKEFLKQNGFSADSKSQIIRDYGEDVVTESVEDEKEIVLDKRDKDFHSKYFELRDKGYVSKWSGEGKVAMVPSDKPVKKRPEFFNEAIEELSVSTDDSKMTMRSEEDGKVTVTTEPKEDCCDKDDEVIVPVDQETEDEISIDVDDFDEGSFDELGESYFKNVYDNVSSFKTSSISDKDGKVVVEGIIKFNSGKSKKTNFVFEANKSKVKGKTVLLGENAQITPNKKAFTLKGAVKDKKFVCESLNYKYNTKDVDGAFRRIYGTARRAVSK